MNKETTDMNGWEKLRIGGNLTAGILIPLVLIVITNIYASAAKERDLSARYIELAIGILRDEPKPESEQIRNWAVDVINRYSEVKLDSTVRKQLLENRILEIPEDAKDFQAQAGIVADSIVGPATLHQLQKDVKELLVINKKIEAIKLVRSVLKLSFKDAKEYVEQIEND